MFESNGSSVFKLSYHLVFSFAYRKNICNDEILEVIKNDTNRISKMYNVTIKEINHDRDHIHISFSAHPNSDMRKFIGSIKTVTSKNIKNTKYYNDIKEDFWNNKVWSRGFCLITTGGVSMDIVDEYIRTQGCHPMENPNRKRYKK